MATHKSAVKRQRQSEKKRVHNKNYRTLMRTTIKKLLTAIEGKKKDEATTLLKPTISMIDKVRSKGIIHRNTASRQISRLTRLVSGL